MLFGSKRSALAVSGVLLAVAVVGCGSSSGTPTAAPVSDPNEIITKGVQEAQSAPNRPR